MSGVSGVWETGTDRRKVCHHEDCGTGFQPVSQMGVTSEWGEWGAGERGLTDEKSVTTKMWNRLSACESDGGDE